MNDQGNSFLHDLNVLLWITGGLYLLYLIYKRRMQPNNEAFWCALIGFVATGLAIVTFLHPNLNDHQLAWTCCLSGAAVCWAISYFTHPSIRHGGRNAR